MQQIIDYETGEIVDDQTAMVQLNQDWAALANVRTAAEALDLSNRAAAIQYYLKRSGAELALQNSAAKLNVFSRHKAAILTEDLPERRGGDHKSKNQNDKNNVLIDAPLTYARLGIDENEAARLRALRELDESEVINYIEETDAKGKEITVSGAVKLGKTKRRRADIERQRQEIASGTAQLPTGVFEVISLDPPWPYGTEYDPNGRRVANPYPEMSLEEISDIELPAAEDCILWLWTTHKFMRHSFALLDEWKFEEKAIVTWVKDHMGIGTWLRSRSEFCIMAVRGKPTIQLTNQTTVIHGPLREHSRKPDSFYEMVDSLCIGRKIDYFSREQRPGWASFGNDIAKFGGSDGVGRETASAEG